MAGSDRGTIVRKALGSATYAALILFTLAQGAIAADPPEPPQSPLPAGTPPWLSDAAKSAEDAARAAGNTLGGWWQDLSNSVMPGGPAGQLPAQISDDDKTFFAILDDIGLKLKEVKVGTGILSNATYRFVASREPTDDDVQRAEQRLRTYRETETGLRSRAKQRIARSTLDTIASAGFALASIEVTLLPWPDASYQVIARPAAASGATPGTAQPQ